MDAAWEAIGDVKKMSESLGMPMLYDVQLLEGQKYASVLDRLGIKNEPQSLMACNYETSEGFVNAERIDSASIARLARQLGYYAVQQYAFTNSNEKNKRNFRHFVTNKGIGLYFQYFMRREMHRLQGYAFNDQEELSLSSEARLRIGIGAEIGWALVEDLVSETNGQIAIIQAVLQTAVKSDNLDLSVIGQRGKSVITILENAPQGSVKFQVLEPRDAKIKGLMKEIAYLRDQGREIRDMRLKLEELVIQLPNQDEPEKVDLARILDEFDEVDENGRRRINPEMKIETFPDYTTIQRAFKNIAMRHEQGGKPYVIIG